MAPFTKPCRTAFRPLLSALAVIALAAMSVAAPAEPFHFLEDAPKTAVVTPPGAWPNGFQVTLTINLKSPDAGGRRVRRPYVAVWVANASSP